MACARQSQCFMILDVRYLDPKTPLQLREGVWSASAHLLKSFLNALLPLEPDAQTEVLESLPSNLVPSVPLVAQKRSSMPPFSSPPISYLPRMDMISLNHGF